MKKVTLIRCETSDQGTFGKIVLSDKTFYTGELPWRDNKNNFSCIPIGLYQARLTYSPAFGRNLYLIDPVNNRYGIRIHPANLMGDTSAGFKCQLNGCISLGERLGWINGQKAVLLSQPAVREFCSILGNEPFLLEVKNA